ncbi:MAG: phosphatidate cytidylyltransferase [Lachnospiraceae bacterium]|nr:phosphatidate cytidylyltransferase [Lachnospiraceae bacterium]
MKTRVISGAVIALLIVFTGYVGSYPLLAFLFVCSVIAYYEMFRALGGLQEGRKMTFPAAAAMLAVCAYYLYMGFAGTGLKADRAFGFSLIVFVIALMLYGIIRFPGFDDREITSAVFSFIYIPYFISFAYRARMLTHGIYIFALIFISSWICDTCAYFTGRAFGRHKLAPHLSPKKTVEGSIGGIVGAAAASFIASLILYFVHGENYMLLFTLAGAAGSVISQAGDLAASAIKRVKGIKDYGRLIPGHGGMMDRFDSVIFTAPVIYLICTLFMGIE